MRLLDDNPPSAPVYAAPIAALVVALGAIIITGFDVWWQLATGWVIVNLKIIPGNDIFSFTAFGAPWINHQWLFQVVQWLIFDHLGESGLVFFKAALLGGGTWLVFRTTSYLTSSRDMALWSAIIFLWGVSFRVMNRPFMVVIILIGVYCLIIHKYIRRDTKAIWLLPLLQVIWINCHGGGLLGPAFVLAFAVGETVQTLLPSGFGGPPPIERRKIERLWLIGLACIATSLINPWGAEIFQYFTDLKKMGTVLMYTQEWFPPLNPKLDYSIPPYIYMLTVLGTFVSFVCNAKRARLSFLFVSGFTSLLLIRGHRFGPEMLVANLPLMFMNFKESLSPARAPRPQRSWIHVCLASVIAALVLIFGVPISMIDKPIVRMGLGAPAFSAPTHLVDFLEYHNIRGRVFNDMGLGAYLIFRRWPRERVFIDGRTPVYGDEFFKEFIEASNNSRNFDETMERYDIDYLVFNRINLWGSRHMHKYLWESKKWRLIYAMEDGLIYLKDVPKFEKLIEKFGIKRNPLIEEMERMEKAGIK